LNIACNFLYCNHHVHRDFLSPCTVAHNSSAENYQTQYHSRSTLVTKRLLPTPISTTFHCSRCRQSTAPPPVTYVTFLVRYLLISVYVHRHDLQVFITFQQHHLNDGVASGRRHGGHTALVGRQLTARGMPQYRRTLQCDTET
jgi:hypothetical protein